MPILPRLRPRQKSPPELFRYPLDRCVLQVCSKTHLVARVLGVPTPISIFSILTSLRAPAGAKAHRSLPIRQTSARSPVPLRSLEKTLPPTSLLATGMGPRWATSLSTTFTIKTGGCQFFTPGRTPELAESALVRGSQNSGSPVLSSCSRIVAQITQAQIAIRLVSSESIVPTFRLVWGYALVQRT